MFKSKFCRELGEMKENIFPKVQLMTAYNSCRRHLKMTVNHKQQNILLKLQRCRKDKFKVVHYDSFGEYIQ